MGRTGGGQLERWRKRLRASAVATSLAAAVLLVLAASAVTAQTDPPAPSLVLQQSLDGQVRCVSPDATCSVVNLYGGPDGDPTPPPIGHGEQRVTTVQLRNAGTLPSSSLVASAGACVNQPLAGATTADLCTALTVAFTCVTDQDTFSFGPETLPRFAQAGALTVNRGLAVGQAATCTFTTTYPADAPVITDAVRAVQPVTWTITAADVPPTTTIPPTTTPITTNPPLPTTTPTTTIPPTTTPITTNPPLPTTTPPTTTPPGVAPTSMVVSPAALAVTGGDPLPLALAGSALLLIGGVLCWISRRHDEVGAGTDLPPG